MILTETGRENIIAFARMTHSELDTWMRLRSRVALYEMEVERAAECYCEPQWLGAMRFYNDACRDLALWVATMAQTIRGRRDDR